MATIAIAEDLAADATCDRQLSTHGSSELKNGFAFSTLGSYYSSKDSKLFNEIPNAASITSKTFY